MKTEILEQKNNPLMKREEIKLLVFEEKTPSFSEAEEIIALKFNKPQENIEIQKIKGKFGRKSFLISAFIYNDIELKKKLSAKKSKGEKTEEKKEAGEKQPEKKEEKQNKPEKENKQE